MPRAALNTLTTCTPDAAPAPAPRAEAWLQAHPELRRYIPASWPDAATLAHYLPNLADLGARIAVAQQRAQSDEYIWST